MAYIASDSAFTTGSGVSVDTFTDGPDYTAGTSSQVTLSENPASENSVWVFFNGIAQHHTEYSINGKVVSFTSVIPANVSTIEVQNNLQLAVGVPGAATVEYSTLTSNATTSLQRKNAIINGNFDLWQRGTSQSTVGYGSADRWQNWFEGTGVTQSMSQQAFALGQTLVPNEPEFLCRNTFVSGTDVSSAIQTFQAIEDVRTFAGETVTFSFWSTASVALDMTLEIQQSFGTGGSPSSVVYATPQKVSLTTSWNKYEVTFDVPSISGKTLGTDGNDKLYAVFWFTAGSDHNTRSDTLGLQSGTIDIAQVQIEKGITATDFERRLIGEELALCQRYFQAAYLPTFNIIPAFRDGTSSVMTTLELLPTEMRAQPSSTVFQSASCTVYDTNGTVKSTTATPIGIHWQSSKKRVGYYFSGGLSALGNQMYSVLPTSASVIINLDAEL